MPSTIKHISVYVLDELNVLSLLVDVVRGRDVCIVDILPLFQPTRSLLLRISKIIAEKSNVHSIAKFSPICAPLMEYRGRSYFKDVFGKVETWQNEYFQYDANPSEDYFKDLLYRQITCNYMRQIHFLTVVLQNMIKDRPDWKYTVSGGGNEFADLWQAHFQTPKTEIRFKRPFTGFQMFLNLVLGLLTLAFTFTAIIRRTRLKELPQRNYFFAADYYSDPTDLRLYKELSKYGNILLVNRNPTQVTIPGIEPFERSSVKTGCFSLKEALSTARVSTLLVLHFVQNYLCYDFRLFYLFCSIPVKRLYIFSFFSRNKVRYFWSRDDYNPEHILRTEFLRQTGGCSIGITHGFPGYARRYPAWRYISFDRYYMISLAAATHSMGDSWDPKMALVPIGTRHNFLEDRNKASLNQDNNIVVYCSVALNTSSMIEFICGLADLFQDRKILLQIKPWFLEQPNAKLFIKACTNERNNVVTTTEKPYELFRRHRFGFSDPSTVIIEGRQLGQFTFFADVSEDQEDSIFRDFPLLRVINAKEAAERILDIERTKNPSIEDGTDGLVYFSKKQYEQVVVEDLQKTSHWE